MINFTDFLKTIYGAIRDDASKRYDENFSFSVAFRTPQTIHTQTRTALLDCTVHFLADSSVPQIPNSDGTSTTELFDDGLVYSCTR